jgi:hypothetical protein
MNRLANVVVIAAIIAVGAPAPAEEPAHRGLLLQSPGYNHPADIDEWRAGEKPHGLQSYPPGPPGEPNPPGGLSQFGGRGATSYAGPDLGMPFAKWRKMMEKQRPEVDRAARAALEERFRLDCRTDPEATMSRGKPLPIGPTARLPEGVESWEAYTAMPAEEIRSRGDFPWKPLDHPLHSTAHILFPAQWTTVHPEHERFDVGFDIPDCYLPEFPPPLYLTTHPELGDVTRGVEITYANYFDMFNGLITPE